MKQSDRVIKASGKKRGSAAEVRYVYNNEQMEIRYYDNPRRSYDVKIKNYVLVSDWVKSRHRPYKPKGSTIKWVVKIIAEDAFELDGRKYVSLMSWVSSRLIGMLIDKGFLGKIGRLGFLFHSVADWEKWENSEIKKRAVGHPIHYNCVVYQVLKDINQFNG